VGEAGENALDLFGPAFELESFAHSDLSFVIVNVEFNYFDVDFIAKGVFYVGDVGDDFEIGVGQI
jgi:hypothetical protein